MTDIAKLRNFLQRKKQSVVFGLLAFFAFLGMIRFGFQLAHDFGHVDITRSLVGLAVMGFSLLVYIWFLIKSFKL